MFVDTYPDFAVGRPGFINNSITLVRNLYMYGPGGDKLVRDSHGDRDRVEQDGIVPGAVQGPETVKSAERIGKGRVAL